MARLLMDKGVDHESAVLANYTEGGDSVFDASTLRRGGDFDEWARACEDLLIGPHDVIYQMPLSHDGMRGVADFVERVSSSDSDEHPRFEPVDAKLTRSKAKAAHVLQLCFYADALEALTGHRPVNTHIELGSGQRETVRLADVSAYWRRLKSRLQDAQLRSGTSATRPLPCDHCPFCEFRAVCEEEWRMADSLVFVANLRAADRSRFEEAGIETLAALASVPQSEDPIAGVAATSQNRAIRQASLQHQSRERPTQPPAFETVEHLSEEPQAASSGSVSVGFGLLPEPDEGDVFLDFEGHPFWRPDTGLFFLFGLIEADSRDPSGWRYRAWWAHDRDQERTAAEELIGHLVERRSQFPRMHVYHYNHTERTALERLCVEHSVAEVDIDSLVQTGAFVDLYPIVVGSVRIGVESYGLKHVERLTGYERREGIDQGSGAVVDYEAWMTGRDDQRLERIAAYNEDDVRATKEVRDWLVTHRPSTLAWRRAQFERSTTDENLDHRVGRLRGHPDGSAEQVLGDLLGYWRRERRAVASQVFAQGAADTATQMSAPGTIAAPQVLSTDEAVGTTGKSLSWTRARLVYPEQTLSTEVSTGSRLVEVRDDGQWEFFDVVGSDPSQRTIDVKWPPDRLQSDCPAVLVQYDWVNEGSKIDALIEIADLFLDHVPPPMAHSILARTPAQFAQGVGPPGEEFRPDLDAILEWVPKLEGSCVPIQGPPGTGKTYTGSHVVRELVNAGKRVGILAMSHHAIDNLVDAVVERFAQAGELGHVSISRKIGPGDDSDSHDAVAYTTSNKTAADIGHHVVAGTAWFFAHPEMRANPVDVLVVDEAGQLGLADLLASSLATKAMVILGDPQQLPHVSQASHPPAASASGLGYLLNGDPVVDDQKGVFLDTTWRMVPPLAGFVSESFYEGRLNAHPSCAIQTTASGVGLRWLEANHEGESTASVAEAELIQAEIVRLIGQPWTDRFGERKAIAPDDVIVVVPYNHQRRCITDLLSEDPTTRDVQVGTVDKFQGREAPVVFFSMTSSSQADMPRAPDFLFSPNRLNVAVSRARCLAYLVSTRRILDSTASTVEEMRMLNVFASLAEQAQPVPSSVLSITSASDSSSP